MNLYLQRLHHELALKQNGTAFTGKNGTQTEESKFNNNILVIGEMITISYFLAK